MTTFLDEVSGARERPGNCPIQIARDETGTITIVIPARGVSPIVYFLSGIVLCNLLLMLYTGLMLLVAHRSVLVMAQVSPGGLPVSLRHYDAWLLLGLGLAEALGFWTVAAVLRPVFFRERLELGPEWLCLQQWEWGRVQERRMARADVRGFLLKRVPPGLDSSTLTVQGRGEQVRIGEFLREADREWLASAGNALLLQQPPAPQIP